MMVGYAPDAAVLEGNGGNADTSSRVQAIVNIYGPTDLTTEFARSNDVVKDFLGGKTYDEASSTLQAAGLKVTRTDKESDQDPGTVLAQNPKGGVQVATGSSVALVVAKAPSTVEVPDVTGEDVATAVRKLSSEGFEINQQTRDVDSPEALASYQAGKRAFKASMRAQGKRV